MKPIPGANLRPIEFRIVCAIARMVFLRQPSMTDSEWKAATKDAIAKQQFEEPGADMLQRAIGAVERALALTMGPRQLPNGPVAPVRAEAAPAPSVGDWRAMAATIRLILQRTAETQPANVVRMAQETLELDEQDALDVFYRQAQDDRLGALRRFAELAIVRPDEWNTAAVRAEAERPHRLVARECFGCSSGNRVLNWHHVIQIQHGGSNTPRNRCAICDRCHAAIHPWLPSRVRVASGFRHIGDLATPAVLRSLVGQKEQAS